MVKRIYDYEKYLGSSKKFKKFLEGYETQKETYRSYRLHLTKFFQDIKIDDVDSFVKDTRLMNKKEKIKYLDNLEKVLIAYWKKYNEESKGKTPYLWLTAIKMFLLNNKTFEMDNVFAKMSKNGHGNRAVTNTKTPMKQQLLKIFSYSNPESKALFMFQMTSGQRIDQVVKTTFNDIEGLGKYDKKGRDYEYPRIFYHSSKAKTIIKSRITPEAKKLLIDYLDQREKFIQTRKKRGEHRRNKPLDMNHIFPMDTGTANAIWTTMLKNAGLYELDPVTNKPVYGTHCLRRYFLNHFTDMQYGDFFSGHITARTREYRQYSDEKLDKVYRDNSEKLIIFESAPDLTEVHKELSEKDKQIQNLKDMMDEMKAEINELRFQKLEKNGKKLEGLIEKALNTKK